MGELRNWCITALAIFALWCGLFFLMRLTIPIPADEPPEAFGAAGMEFIPILFGLGFVTVCFGVVAFLRVAFAVTNRIVKVGRKH
jgi:hypothetical protein